MSDFPGEYKENQDGSFDNIGSHMPHSSGKFYIFVTKNLFILYNFNPFSISESEHTLFPRQLTPEVLQALRSVRFIAQHIKDADKDNEVSLLYYGSSAESFFHYILFVV